MNILLCCSQGLSSSMLCAKMKKYAAAQGKDDKIWAVGLDIARDELNHADFLLLGPHMRAAARSLTDLADSQNIPYMTLDRMDYAYGNAKAVYSKMYQQLEQNNK